MPPVAVLIPLRPDTEYEDLLIFSFMLALQKKYKGEERDCLMHAGAHIRILEVLLFTSVMLTLYSLSRCFIIPNRTTGVKGRSRSLLLLYP